MRQPDFYVDLTTLSGNQIRQVWGRHSARQLARNMGLGGVPRPPGNGLPLAGGNMAWAAHHIVPGNLNQVLFRGTFPPNPMQRHGHIPSVIAARTRLADLGVRVNDSDNGVWLPQVRQGRANRVPGTTIHNHVHTPRYFDEVWNRLQGAQTEGQARATLQQIAQELALGIFPY
ncbi:MAG: AHH domain-containing protein [Nodosilinea sp.]